MARRQTKAGPPTKHLSRHTFASTLDVLGTFKRAARSIGSVPAWIGLRLA
ncbi:hypothetical protein [Aeoliella sp. SH292]